MQVIVINFASYSRLQLDGFVCYDSYLSEMKKIIGKYVCMYVT